MCKSKAQGGKRCYTHTKASYDAAVDAVARGKTGAVERYRTAVDALATTRRGEAFLRQRHQELKDGAGANGDSQQVIGFAIARHDYDRAAAAGRAARKQAAFSAAINGGPTPVQPPTVGPAPDGIPWVDLPPQRDGAVEYGGVFIDERQCGLVDPDGDGAVTVDAYPDTRFTDDAVMIHTTTGAIDFAWPGDPGVGRGYGTVVVTNTRTGARSVFRADLADDVWTLSPGRGMPRSRNCPATQPRSEAPPQSAGWRPRLRGMFSR